MTRPREPYEYPFDPDWPLRCDACSIEYTAGAREDGYRNFCERCAAEVEAELAATLRAFGSHR